MFKRYLRKKRREGSGAVDGPPPGDLQSLWLREQLLSDGDQFFDSLIVGIGAAISSIDIEAYIFCDDPLGQRVEQALIAAASRGVRVRVIVDGIGSQGWVYSLGARLKRDGIETKVYHPLPWQALPVSRGEHDVHLGVLKLFSVINRRNHRKLCIVDNWSVWLGSLNIWDVTLPSKRGENAWRELGLKMEGESAIYLKASFDFIWYSRTGRFRRIRRSAKKMIKQADSVGIRLNVLLPSRLAQYQDLIDRINQAQKRVWIVNAYFVPARSLIEALGSAAGRGVDVRVLTPLQSDVKFMPWVAHTFFNTLSAAGVGIYCYTKSILHAKYMLIDDAAIVGSSNLNHRSLLHDLELDILTCNYATVKAVAQEFERDISVSQSLTRDKLGFIPLWQRCFGKIALIFKYYL